ncbi:unnamed protein product, partial [Prunus brigantina]
CGQVFHWARPGKVGQIKDLARLLEFKPGMAGDHGRIYCNVAAGRDLVCWGAWRASKEIVSRTVQSLCGRIFGAQGVRGRDIGDLGRVLCVLLQLNLLGWGPIVKAVEMWKGWSLGELRLELFEISQIGLRVSK